LEAARNGHGITHFAAATHREALKKLSLYPSSLHALLKNNEPFDAGELFVQPDLARTLETIERGGAEAWYRGPLCAAVADLDRSGSLDVVVTNLGGAPDLYLSEGSPRSWIRLRLLGASSNRDGLGAVVTIGRKRREHRLSDGFLGSNEPVVHFGLAGAVTVPRLEVSWPSGARDVCLDVPALRTHVIKEGVGCLPGGSK
jgi:hypothetical protein